MMNSSTKSFFKIAGASCLLSIGYVQVYAQTKSAVSGIVQDERGESLPGATVTLSNTDNKFNATALTNSDGLFSFTNVPLGKGYTILVSYMGYDSQLLPDYNLEGGEQQSMVIKLKAKKSNLNEVVVTALGIKKEERALGYSAQKIDGQSLTDAPSSNWLNTLSGKVPGMNLQKLDGPTGSANIILRGNKSFDLDNNSALIVVDGIVVSNKVMSNNGGNNLASESPVDFGSAISDINADDIENVTVLKGPGAAALYGSRGANGAIVITTKSGKNKKGLGVTVNSSVTFDQVNNWPDYQYQYGQGGAGGADYYSYGATIDGAGTQGTSQAWGPKLNTGASYFQYNPITRKADTVRTPWVSYDNNRKDLFRTGVTYNNSVSLDGGNDKTSMRLSYNNVQNKWILPNTGYTRNTINLSVQHKLNNKVRVFAKVNYTNKQSDNLPNLGYDNKTVTYFLLGQAPNVDLNWYKDYWIKENEQQFRPFSTLLENPYFALYEQLNPVNRNAVFGNVGLAYDILPGLSFTAKSGIDFSQDISSSRQPKSSQRFIDGMYNEQNALRYEINTDFLLSYNKPIGKDFKLGVSFGGNNMSYSYNRTKAAVSQLVIPGVYNLNNGVNRPVFSGYKEEKVINSLYGFINLSYKDYLYLDITARNDWSSTLPLKNNSYFYPSANLSAIISDMFNIQSNVLSYAKLRASISSVGSDTRGYKISKYYTGSPFAGSLENPDVMPNYDLKPEITHSYEFGTEVRLLKNRIGLDVAVYQNNTYNQILEVPVERASGYRAAAMNAGLVINKGIEATVWAIPVKLRNFSWKTTGLFSKNRGEIVRLQENVEAFQIASGPGGVALVGVPGGEIGDIYGRGYVRAPDGQIVYENGLPLLGTEVARRGNANPDFKLGFNNEFTYKDFRLNILWDGEFGAEKYSLMYSQLMQQGKLNATIPGRDEGGILGDGVVLTEDGNYVPNETVVKAVSTFYGQHYVRENVESNMLDASYIKLREVRLDYNFKFSFFRRVGIRNASIGVFGRDLLLISKWQIFDPEASSINNGLIIQGFEVGQLPSTRSMGINLKVGF
ncbi:MAG: SusC/RagA family TonB-linked outer membrane protein [Taibaiella sp.]|jgi:TonB-linked SusC/RagA family outer membrane protein